MYITIIIIALLVILAAIVIVLKIESRELSPSDRAEISIRESIYYTKMPLFPIELENGERVNFILDSASNVSHINEDDLDLFVHNETENSQSVMGIEGNCQDVDKAKIVFSYKNNVFDIEACKSNLSKTFKHFSQEIKKMYDTDVKVVGLLGNDFLTKYGYVLDFNDLIVYKKKKTKKNSK